jgi:hypothetical protein
MGYRRFFKPSLKERRARCLPGGSPETALKSFPGDFSMKLPALPLYSPRRGGIISSGLSRPSSRLTFSARRGYAAGVQPCPKVPL